MRTGIAIWVLGAFLAVASLSAARAQEDDDWGARDRVVSGQVAPLDRILPQIRRNHPGTFYDAQGPFQGPDGELHYRLKWMTPEGRVIWFDANARTGRVLGADVGRRDFGNRDYGGPNDGAYERNPNYSGQDYGRPNDGGSRGNFRDRQDYDGGGFGYGPGGRDWGGGRGNWQGGGRGNWGGRGDWPGGGGGGGRRGGGFGGGRDGDGRHGHGGY